jgi:hypothetical protein
MLIEAMERTRTEPDQKQLLCDLREWYTLLYTKAEKKLPTGSLKDIMRHSRFQRRRLWCVVYWQSKKVSRIRNFQYRVLRK